MYGSGNYSLANYGTGVAEAYGLFASTSTVNTFGIAQWESQSLVTSAGVVLSFGGLIHGATGYIQGTTIMYSSPVFTWMGCGDIETVQGTVLTFGYIAWDGQSVDDATWTNQTVS